MSGSSVVPGPLGREVGEDVGGVQLPQPVERVRPTDAVLGVLVRATRRLRRRRPGRRGLISHGRDGSAARALAALAFATTAVVIPGLATPVAQAADDEPVTF